jgi:ketosteroid isomerase-like protein
MTDQNAETEAAAVRHFLDEFGAAVSREDYPAVLDMITDDAVFWPANSPAISGKAIMKVAYDALRGYRVHAEFEPEEIQICGDWAFARGYESFTLEPKAGGPKVEIKRRRALTILKRENGRWKTARGMTNYAAPTENPRPAGT